MFSYRKKIIAPQNKKIIFLICGWPGKIWNYYFTAKILELHGYQSIIYEFDDSILSSSITATVRNTTLVKNDILKRLGIFKEKGFKDFSIFGTSYGTVIAFMVADNFSSVSNMIINLSGADLAETVWSWNRGKEGKIKNELKEMGISLKYLKKKWSRLNPVNNTSHLSDKRILFYISHKDEVIPYKLQLDLLNTLNRVNKEVVTVSNLRSNHLFSAAVNLIRYDKYINFLESVNMPTQNVNFALGSKKQNRLFHCK